MMKKTIFLIFIVLIFTIRVFPQGFEKSRVIFGATMGLSWGLGTKIQAQYAITDYLGAGFNYVYSDFGNNKWDKANNVELSDKLYYKVSRYSAFVTINGYPKSAFNPYFLCGFGYNDYTLPTIDPADIWKYRIEYQSEWYMEVEFGLRYFIPGIPVSIHIETGQPIILGGGIEFVF